MGIQIINQTNEQECGVCALVALHNHFYNDDLPKEQALDKSQISQEGMTIFDFESLGHKLGLDCESYEIQFSEFKNLKIKNYFVLLLSTQNSTNHYVIARKKNNYVEIYDSCSMDVSKITYKQLENIFLNVVILINKKPNPAFSKIFGDTKTLLMFDLKFVLLNLGLSALIFGLSILAASFLNFIIDQAISKSSINNLITIAFIFLLIYFCNNILTYISSLYMSKHTKNYFILFTNKILSSLQNKKPDFFNKVDKNWIFKIDECVYNISNFCVFEINRFITSGLCALSCICVIGSIQYYLLIFIVFYILVELIFFLFQYRKKKDVFLNVVRSENSNAQHYKNLINSLSNELWLTKRQKLIQLIKNNYSNIYKNYHDVILFKSNSSLFKTILKDFCELCVVVTMSVMIIKTKTESIGKLTFAVSAFALFINSCQDFCGYLLSKLEFNVYWQVYKDITSVSNIGDNKFLCLIKDVKTISFKNNDFDFQINRKNKFNFAPEPILETIKSDCRICINQQPVQLNKKLMDLIVVVDQHSQANNQILIDSIAQDPDQYSKYLQYFNLDLNKQTHSFYHQIIINLLSLLSEKNKMIFIDDLHRYIPKSDLIIVKQIVHKVEKDNVVFILGKEEND